MIEIALGLVLVAAVVAVMFGVGGLVPGASGIDLLPLLGYGGVALLLAAGLLLVAARNPGQRRGLRTARLTTAASLVVALLAIGLPLAAEPANLVRLEGLPLGYYLAAQGVLIGLVILAFAWASRQNRIERAERGHG
jgi:putative solute:sodium symporter small subunit